MGVGEKKRNPRAFPVRSRAWKISLWVAPSSVGRFFVICWDRGCSTEHHPQGLCTCTVENTDTTLLKQRHNALKLCANLERVARKDGILTY